MNYYEFLGLETDAKKEDIFSAYTYMTQKLTTGVIDSEKTIALDMNKKVYDAFITLSDEELRKSYDVIGEDMPTDIQEKIMFRNIHNYAYQVKMAKRRDVSNAVNIPQCCACCLSDKITTQYSAAVYERKFGTLYRAYSIQFPICTECADDIDQAKNKRRIVTIAPPVIALIIVQILNLLSGLLSFVLVGFISIGLFILLGLCIKLEKKSMKHSSRSLPVRFNNDNEIMYFEFDNWLYAEKFALNNNAKIRKIKKIRHLNFNSFLLGYDRRVEMYTNFIMLTILATVLSLI